LALRPQRRILRLKKRGGGVGVEVRRGRRRPEQQPLKIDVQESLLHRIMCSARHEEGGRRGYAKGCRDREGEPARLGGAGRRQDKEGATPG
jgi:hypothetical protein